MEIGRDAIHITRKPVEEIIKKDMEFFGEFGSGLGDLSIHRKRYLKEALHAKHRRH